MRSISTLVALVGLTLPLRAQTQGDSPEAVTQQYVTALRANDWKRMTALMHPQALARFRGMMSAVLHSNEGKSLRDEFFGGATAAQLDSLNDADFYSRFLAAVMRSEPDLEAAMDSAQITIVGHVEESPDIVHVVFTMRLAMGPISISKPDIVTLKRQGNTWRALLRAEMEIMAATLEQRFRS